MRRTDVVEEEKKLCSCQKVLIHLESNITYLSYVYLAIVKYYTCYEMLVMDLNIIGTLLPYVHEYM
jgi:hypothetical protein